MKCQLLVAVDGPAGAGKSTVARRVAEKLGMTYVDTGAMYRAIAWKMVNKCIDIEDEEAVSKTIASTSLYLENDELYVDGLKVTEKIRTPEVSASASKVAKIHSVRTYLTQKQREIAKGHSVVMDGRDIGTHVLPDADVKIFLTASIHQRSLRRFQELREKGIQVEVNHLQEEIRLRDLVDSTRKHSPLKKAGDAILLDTTDKSIQEVVEIICEYCRQKKLNASYDQ